MFRRFLLSTFLLLAPFTVQGAAVTFDHIEYNPSGADQNREWIRIHNVSGAPLDLTGWRLYEGGVNHTIKAVDTPIIPAGAYAVLAADATQYFAEHLDSPDVLFDSSFSLSNSGETIALKDGKLVVVAQTSYVAEPKAKPQVAGVSAKAPGTKPVAAVPEVIESARTPISAAVLEGTGFPNVGGLVPWLLGVLGLVLVAGGALIFLKKDSTASGYHVIDISDKPK